MTQIPQGPQRGLSWLDHLSLAVTAAIAAVALGVWRLGPTGPLPMHVSAAGQVDRWGDRTEAALVLGFIAATAGAVALLCTELERRGKVAPGHGVSWIVGRIVGLAAPAFAAGAIVLVSVGGLSSPADVDGLARMTMGFISLVFLGVGAFLGRTRPNRVVGVRTWWSLRSRLAWDKSNRLAGRLMSLLGIAGLLAAPLAPQPLGLHLLNAALLLVAGLAVFESWRVWRVDPDRA